MGVEEILLQQAEEKVRKEGRVKANNKLKEAIRNMLVEGFHVPVIFRVLEVSEDFVRTIQAEMN